MPQFSIYKLTKKCFGAVLLVLFFMPINIFAQKPELQQTVRGTVIDKNSQSPLFGASVVLLGSEPLRGTTTNEKGHFRLENIPVGRQQLKVSYIGYKEIVLPVLVTSGKEIVLNIEIEEAVYETDEVVIRGEKDKSRANNEMSTVSARSFNVDEANRYAGSRLDIARMASNYAGVVGGGDMRNDIVIRGNSPSGLLWRLEGVDIPNPNHFAAIGSTGGPVGMLNANVLSNSDFMTGAFTADYANALSGVFDIRMRNGNNEKHEFTGQVGLNGFEFGAEGPIKKTSGSSFLVSYRYSTLAVLQKLGVNFGTGTGIPFYQDLSFKINLPTKKGNLSFFGLGGLSHIALLKSTSKKPDSYTNDNQDVYFGSKLGATGFTYTHFINTNTYFRSTFAASYEQNQVSVDSLDTDWKPHDFYNEINDRYRYSANFTLNKKFNARVTAKSGLMVDLINFNLNYNRYYIHENGFRNLLTNKGQAFLTRAFTQWSYKFNEKLSFNPGLSFTHFALNNSWALEPRAGFAWEITPSQRLSLGYGMHSRLQELPIYFVETKTPNGIVHTNKNLGLSKAQHFILGYDLKLTENLRIKAETYYQQLWNIPVETRSSYFSMINTGSDFSLQYVDSLQNNGTGENYGIELTLERFFYKGYYFLITTSLYQSTYKGSDGVSRNTAFNGNYILNTLAGREIKLGKNFTMVLDGKVTYAGGRRYIPVDLEKSKALTRQVNDYTDPFRNRFPDYFRLDVKAGLRIETKKITQEISFYVENITDHKNILSEKYDVYNQKVTRTYQLGIFPIAMYRINF